MCQNNSIILPFTEFNEFKLFLIDSLPAFDPETKLSQMIPMYYKYFDFSLDNIYPILTDEKIDKRINGWHQKSIIPYIIWECTQCVVQVNN